MSQISLLGRGLFLSRVWARRYHKKVEVLLQLLVPVMMLLILWHFHHHWRCNPPDPARVWPTFAPHEKWLAAICFIPILRTIWNYRIGPMILREEWGYLEPVVPRNDRTTLN